MPMRPAVPLSCALLFFSVARDAAGQAAFVGGAAGIPPPVLTPRVWRATRPFVESFPFTDGSGRTYQVRGERHYDLVLLRDPETVWKGTVWMAVHAKPGLTAHAGGLVQRVADGVAYQAYRGTYLTFRHPTDKDIAVLHVALTRKYFVGGYVQGRRYHEGNQEPPGTDLDWAQDTAFEPTGTAVEAPAEGLVDAVAVFQPKLALTPVRAFFVDDRGAEIVRRFAPSGVREKLLGGAVRDAYPVECLPLGAALRFAEADVIRERHWKSPPPTFQP